MNDVPHSIEAEQALVGALLAFPNRADDVVGVLRPEDFYAPRLGAAFALLLDMRQRGEVVDEVTVFERLSRDPGRFGPPGEVMDLARKGSTNVTAYAKRLRDLSTLRTVIDAAQRIIEDAMASPTNVAGLVDSATASMMALGAKANGKGWRRVSEVIPDVKALEEEDARAVTITLPWSTLHWFANGPLKALKPGQLVIVGARPAMGKSAFALGCVEGAVLSGGAAGMFSLEMSDVEQVNRLLRQQGEKTLARWPVYVDDRAGVSLADVIAGARRLVALAKQRNDPPLRMIVVDYLQLMKAEVRRGGNRAEALGEISGGLKVMARELGIVVVALAQLNRELERRDDKRPMMSDLRESGALEQDADTIVFLYRDAVYNRDTPEPNIAEVIIAKQRAGETGFVKLEWRGESTQFLDLPEPGFAEVGGL